MYAYVYLELNFLTLARISNNLILNKNNNYYEDNFKIDLA